MKRSIDFGRTVRMTVIGLGFFVVVVGVVVTILNLLHANLVEVIVVFAVVFIAAALIGSRILSSTNTRLSRRYAAIRQAARQPAESAGWHYQAEGPPPSREIAEAVFRSSQYPLVAGRELDVITGTFHGRSFTAAYIDGYEVGYGSNTDPGPARGENIVVMQLTGLLPELRLRDRSTSKSGDYGIALPSLSSGDAAVDSRWDIQTMYPEFARSLLDPAMLAYLAAVPNVPCTIVIRDGQLISCRDPEGSFESISARLAILGGFANRIPDTTPVSPAIAGHGAYKLRYARESMSLWETTRS